jgi:hypothetical protein
MTVQALEVQRMTLSTLQTMNLPLADLRSALSATPASATAPSAPPPSATATPAAAASKPAAEAAAGAAARPAVDPMQWWGALTQQFTDIATKAMQEGGSLASRNLAAATSPPKAPAKKARAAGTARKSKG